jgi:hypothetical protein
MRQLLEERCDCIYIDVNASTVKIDAGAWK